MYTRQINNAGPIEWKVRLLVGSEPPEVRRFKFEVLTNNLSRFILKLHSVFPQLQKHQFKLTWSDDAGDATRIANDEEFQMAVMGMKTLKVIEVHMGAPLHVPPKEIAAKAVNTGIAYTLKCDVCKSHIKRYRFKCLQCYNYDICLTCEQAGKHSHHAMMRLVDTVVPIELHEMLRGYIFVRSNA